MRGPSTLRNAVVCFGCMTLTMLVGCGGGGENPGPDGSSSGYKFSEVFVGCGDSIDITMSNGAAFPADTTVEFQGNAGNNYNGDAVGIQNNKTLVTGFPTGAAKGLYRVIVNGTDAGELQNLCGS